MSEKVLGEYIIRLVCGETDGDVVPVRTTIETTPIVRCRDCEAFHEFHTYAGKALGYGECLMHRRQTDRDRFCAWGERR